MLRREFLQTSGILLAAQAVVPNRLEAAEKETAPTAAAGTRHPLYFTSEAVSRLRQRLAADRSVALHWSALLERAEALLQAPLVPEDEARQPAQRGVALQGRYRSHSARQLVEMSMRLGLAYQITGEERYAQKLRQALLHYAGYEQWCSPGYNTRTPPWNSDLATPEFCFGAAAGYDAIHDFLSADDRKRIEEALARLGILPILNDWVLPEQRIHALDSMGHNWWSVCVAGAGIGALALQGRDPRAAAWAEAAENALDRFFDYGGMVLQNKPANFDPAGGFYEGVGYADYALSEYLTFRLARINALPAKPAMSIPVLERSAEFFVHSTYPSSVADLMVNFGDSGLTRQSIRAMRLLAMQGFAPELTRWHLARSKPDRQDPLNLLYLDERAAPARNTLPLSVIYPTIGWAMLRTSWKNDATMLAVKCGDTWNHAHADAASFILFHTGRPLLIDSGACSYGNPAYSNYYRQSRAHNVVLFNGQGQPTEDFHQRGVKFPGRLHSLLDGLGLKYLYADATGPMARHLSRNYRHWLWLDGVILVFDDLLAHEAGTFDWLLHYEGEARHQGGDVELTNGPAKARVTMLFPEAPRVHEEEGLAEQQPEKKVAYLALSTKETAREQKFIVAIVPEPPDSAPRPKVELLREPLALGVRVHSKDGLTDVYLNLQADGRRMHVNSNHTIAGWETDAYLFALTRPAASAAATPESVTRYFVSAASYLRKDGQTVLDSLSKMEAAFQPGEKAEVLLEGQKRVEASVYSPRKPAGLSVNRKAVTFEYQPKERTIRFRHES